jgi:hypothetical protein
MLRSTYNEASKAIYHREKRKEIKTECFKRASVVHSVSTFNQTSGRLRDYGGRPCLKRNAGLENTLHGCVHRYKIIVVQLGRKILFKAEEDFDILRIFECDTPANSHPLHPYTPRTQLPIANTLHQSWTPYRA